MCRLDFVSTRTINTALISPNYNPYYILHEALTRLDYFLDWSFFVLHNVLDVYVISFLCREVFDMAADHWQCSDRQRSTMVCRGGGHMYVPRPIRNLVIMH